MGREGTDAPVTRLKTRDVRARLDELGAALIARGLTVRVGNGGLIAKNPAASATDSPLGKALNPGLSQAVALTGHGDGSMHWYWCWTGPTRDAPLETEYLGPASEIEPAAEKISRVLRTRE